MSLKFYGIVFQEIGLRSHGLQLTVFSFEEVLVYDLGECIMNGWY